MSGGGVVLGRRAEVGTSSILSYVLVIVRIPHAAIGMPSVGWYRLTDVCMGGTSRDCPAPVRIVPAMPESSCDQRPRSIALDG